MDTAEQATIPAVGEPKGRLTDIGQIVAAIIATTQRHWQGQEHAVEAIEDSSLPVTVLLRRA